MAGYLFAHFIGEQKDGEQIYFAISKDGLHWMDLNAGFPVLKSNVGTFGVRDPFLVKHPITKKCYILATDLRIEAGHGWRAAQEAGSRDIVVWESEDLVHWSDARIRQVGIPKAGCVWAPEAVYDDSKNKFLVFFASKVKTEDTPDGKHRIYATYTDDFVNFSETFLYMERESDVIDTTILNANGKYYRISKNEETKRLLLEVSDSINGNFTQIHSRVLESLEGVEGPEAYLLPDGNTWCVIADQFLAGKGYMPMLTKDLDSGDFMLLDSKSYDMGKLKKRHGGVLQITDEEYERLWQNYGTCNPVVSGLYADPDLYYENGIYYIYPTTDGAPHWSGHEFYVFSSEDGKHFEKKAKILDVSSEQVPWAVGYAWAPCITKKSGRYYFYFCAKRKDGKSCIGVAVADSPTGPFCAEPKPLVTMEMMETYGIRMSQTIDPSIYQEGDDYYLVFGNGNAAIAKLSEDLLRIEESTLRNIDGLYDFRESLIITKRNDKYHFTWSCDDTGSENYHVNYGTANSLYGPVIYQYLILEKDDKKGILGTGHHSIVQLNDGRYMIAYHRFATPLSNYPEGKGWHRECCIAQLTFDENKLMMPVCVF